MQHSKKDFLGTWQCAACAMNFWSFSDFPLRGLISFTINSLNELIIIGIQNLSNCVVCGSRKRLISQLVGNLAHLLHNVVLSREGTAKIGSVHLKFLNPLILSVQLRSVHKRNVL